MKEAYTPPTGATRTASAQVVADKIEKKLQEQLIRLPLLPKPIGSYVPVVRSGKMLYISGQLPIENNSLGAYKGRLGREISVEAGKRAAKACALNALAWVKHELRGLDKVKQAVKLTGFVASAVGFSDQPSVINGASDLLVDLYGEAGKHARSAVGVTDLPMGACVEIEFIFEAK